MSKIKVGSKVTCKANTPVSASFKGVGTVKSVKKMPNVSGGYALEVSVEGEITNTRDDLVTLVGDKKLAESSSDKELDHTDTYKGLKWESWYDSKTEKYDVWVYLKAGKTLVAKNVDPSPYNIKTVAWEKIDKIPASKKPVKKLAESLLGLVESKTTVKDE